MSCALGSYDRKPFIPVRRLSAPIGTDAIQEIDVTEEKRLEIEQLAADAYDKRQRYEALSMANTPSDPEEKKAAKIAYALAYREMIEADRALDHALNA
jgi:hypothetical protein